MKTSKHTNSRLVEMNNHKLKEIHSNKLGLKVPVDYFSKSKTEILSQVLMEKEPKKIAFYRKKSTWLVAATIALIFGITVFKPFSILDSNNSTIVITDTVNPLLQNNLVAIDSPTISEKDIAVDFILNKSQDDNTKLETMHQDENNIVIKSLFLEDKEINQCVNNYMLEDI